MTQQEYNDKIQKLEEKIQKLDAKRVQAVKWHDQRSARTLRKMINTCKGQIKMLEQYATITK